jgi:hypothetical protein
MKMRVPNLGAKRGDFLKDRMGVALAKGDPNVGSRD